MAGRDHLSAPDRRRAARTRATASTSRGWPACRAEVVERAKAILANLENAALDERDRPKIAAQTVRKKRAGSAAARSSDGIQLTIFGRESELVADTLRRLDLSGLTPEEALKKLEEVKRLAAGE